MTTGGNTPHAVLSPDGKYFAYVANMNGKQSVRLRLTSNSADSEILAPDDVIYQSLAISPDSQTITTTKRRVISVVVASTESPYKAALKKKYPTAAQVPR